MEVGKGRNPQRNLDEVDGEGEGSAESRGLKEVCVCCVEGGARGGVTNVKLLR